MKINTRTAEKEIRASRIYHDWKQNNKTIVCSHCGSTDNLELHHIIPLRTLIKYYYNHFQNRKQTIQYILEKHKNNEVESATLCEKCHDDKHRNRPRSNSTSKNSSPPAQWCVAPRYIEQYFDAKKSSHKLNHMPFQVLLILGNFIVKGQIKDNLIITNHIEIAKLMNKKVPSSWKTSIEKALENLKHMKFISSYTIISNKKIKIYLSKNYLEEIVDFPWFILLSEVPSPNMTTLAIKWYLCTLKNNKKKFKIGIELLKKHIGVKDSQNNRLANRIIKSCDSIEWMKSITCENNNIIFRFKSRPVNVNKLWDALKDSLPQYYE